MIKRLIKAILFIPAIITALPFSVIYWIIYGGGDEDYIKLLDNFFSNW